MSLNTDIFASTGLVNNNNSNNTDWANFDTFPSTTNENGDVIKSKDDESNEIEDDWAEFQSNTGEHSESTSEDVNTLIATCFPLESLTHTDKSTICELPNFTTFNDEIKQIPSFQQSLS